MSGSVAGNLKVESAEFYASLLRQADAKKGAPAARPEIFEQLVGELADEDAAAKKLGKLSATPEGRLQLVCMALTQSLGDAPVNPNDMAKNFSTTFNSITSCFSTNRSIL